MSKIVRKQTTERMSKIVIHNNIVYLCGQVGEPGTPIKNQATEMLSRVDSLLKEANSSREQLLSATVYLSDIRYFAEFNEVWDAWIVPGHTPARACVEARMALPGIFCEVSVVAAQV